jgi:type VI secretion system secreted protein VgrG
MGQQEKVGTDYALDAGQEIHLKAGMTLVLEAGMRLTIKGPAGFIDFHPAGIDIVGLLVNINSGGAPGFGKGSSPDAPEDAVEAQPRDRPPGAAPATSSGGGKPGTTGQGGG